MGRIVTSAIALTVNFTDVTLKVAENKEKEVVVESPNKM